MVEGDCRLHRRPLYPPADRSLIWTPEQLAKIPRSSFRPLVVAYNEPRFLFDYHAAGGAMGHLFIGVTRGEASKWLHQWSDIAVRYVDGRMEYVLRDPAFDGLAIKLSAAPLAHSVGLIVKVDVAGEAPGEANHYVGVRWCLGVLLELRHGREAVDVRPRTMCEGPHSRRRRQFRTAPRVRQVRRDHERDLLSLAQAAGVGGTSFKAAVPARLARARVTRNS